jgi:hypothetical protein
MIESVGPTRLKEEGFKWPERWAVQSALLIPAFKPDGTIHGYGAKLFYQQRATFGGGDSRGKYISLPGDKKPTRLHFSPLANWDKLEYGQRLFICESYVKANILCKLGFHAIGVSGCKGWSWMGELNPQIRDFDWRGYGLKPVVLMDSNVCPGRPDLWQTIKRFQAAMESMCGVRSYIIPLPKADDESDWGLDDFAMAKGDESLVELAESEYELIPSELDAHLIQLNNEVCYVHEVGRFADIKRNVLMGRGQFEDAAFATRTAFNLEGKPTKVAKAWTTWPLRNEVDALKYKPGEERLVDDGSESYFNLWRGWGCEPLAGDAGLFLEWLEDAFPSSQEREYFLDWWSYQVQHPGIKLNTALMLVGPSGVGKGWMASIAERVFGSDNTWKCNLSDLESRFNSGLGAAQLMVIEEADVAGGVKVYNVLKDMITNEHLRYERKGVDAVKIDNCLNIFMNSNHIDVLALDEFDRRMAVLEITNESIANDATYWEPRWEWLREGGGAAVVFGWLKARTLSASFKPSQRITLVKCGCATMYFVGRRL